MDQDTGLYIVLGFLLLCIVLSCIDKKEGFVVIREDLFLEECNKIGTCHSFIRGLQGMPCRDPPDLHNYVFGNNDGGEPTPEEKYTGENFGVNPTECSNDAYPTHPHSPPSAGECQGSGEAYILTGCSPKCRKPDDAGAAALQGYDIRSAAVPAYHVPDTDPVDVPDITCAAGFTKAKHTCFNKATGNITNDTRDACTGPELFWFNDDPNTNIKIYCDIPGSEYKILGCEPECMSREGPGAVSNYLSIRDGSGPLHGENLQEDYRDYKERIEWYPNRTNSETGDSVFLNTFPYSEGSSPYTSFDPHNFAVEIVPADGWDDVRAIQQCDITNMSIGDNRKKYYVKGLYPSCDPQDGVECLNFSIEYGPEDHPVPINLEAFRATLPVENIFSGDTPEGEDLLKYQESLYYFRRFKSDGNDVIEGQIRCDTDPASRFNCNITQGESTHEYCAWLGTEEGGGCNGGNREMKLPEEIALWNAGANGVQNERDREGTEGEGDNNFQSPCCKWVDVGLPQAGDLAYIANGGKTEQEVFGQDWVDFTHFLNDSANECPRIEPRVALAAGRPRQERQCGTYKTELIDNQHGASFRIEFIHNHPRGGDADCTGYQAVRPDLTLAPDGSCYCPQKADGTFWTTSAWALGMNPEDWNHSSNPEGIVACNA